jgi:hypothetical protein
LAKQWQQQLLLRGHDGFMIYVHTEQTSTALGKLGKHALHAAHAAAFLCAELFVAV